MISTEMIKDMLERQKRHDAEVFKKHKITSVSRQQLESALFDELGELMHAQKADWCWWKFTQEPVDVDKVIEEYIDVVHFALMYEIKFGEILKVIDYKPLFGDKRGKTRWTVFMKEKENE